MKFIFTCITIISMLMLSGCLSPVKVETPNKYVINQLPECFPRIKNRSVTLLVSRPETNPVYDTTRMAYTIKPYQVAYFSKNQWAETPAQMFHPLLVQTLQNTHYFRAIVTPPFTGPYKYMLNTQILELKQNFSCRIPILKMSVRVQLIKMSTERVIATKLFTCEQRITQRSPYGGVFAANRATKIILQQIASFSVKNTK